MSVTRSDLKTALKARLDEDGYDYWSEARMNKLLHKAQRKLAFETLVIEKTFKVGVTASQRDYALPSNFIGIRQIYWQNEPLNYGMREMEWLDQYDSDWRDTTGDEPVAATVINGKLHLYPTPNSAAASLTTPLSMVCNTYPDEFAGDATAMELPDTYEEALLDYAEYLAWLSYDTKKALVAKQSFEMELKHLKGYGVTREGYGARRVAQQMNMKSYRDNY